jgi:hypothetical protein
LIITNPFVIRQRTIDAREVIPETIDEQVKPVHDSETDIPASGQ